VDLLLPHSTVQFGFPNCDIFYWFSNFCALEDGGVEAPIIAETNLNTIQWKQKIPKTQKL